MSEKPMDPRPQRLWPGVVLAVVTFLVRYVTPLLLPGSELFAVIGGWVGALLILLWWVFFSRAGWSERLGFVALAIGAMYLTSQLLHESVARGNLGFQLYIHAVPVVAILFVIAVLLSRSWPDNSRRVAVTAAILVGCGLFALLRSEGLDGQGSAIFAFRWSPTAEERLLAQAGRDPVAAPGAVATSESAAEWPGFRGRNRDGIVRGTRIETNWESSPPEELWRRPVGPGVSSFAVSGDRVFTQEQRGEDEVVTCYSAATGEPVWRHRTESRFYDSHVGAGPRATPTYHDGRVFAFGAKGELNALHAADGSVLWSRDIAAETGARVPGFGFVSSPLVVNDLVVVHTNALVAHDVETGERQWISEETGGGYSSPHLLTIDGDEQILLTSDRGAMAVSPQDGSLLWRHEWNGVGILQPAMTADGDVLFSMVNEGAMPLGIRRIAVAREPGGWSSRERWTTERLRTSFATFVVHEGHAYGFDGRILTSIDLETGERAWKGGRYGAGQVLLLPDQDLLLVVSEEGELALVRATPEAHEELARVPAITGRSWSQPALVGDLLLVRNGEEMAAFRLAWAAS